MKNFYYDLSGGINLAQSKIALGMDTKRMCWADAENIEIYQNRGIVRMRGNALVGHISAGAAGAALNDGDAGAIVCIAEYGVDAGAVSALSGASGSGGRGDFVAVTAGGCFWFYDALAGTFELKKSGLGAGVAGAALNDGGAGVAEAGGSSGGGAVSIVPWGAGVVVCSAADAPFYFEVGRTVTRGGELVLEEIVEFGDEGADGKPVRGSAAAVFAGRLWIAGGSTLWYSALGTFDDWTTAEDAGYISDFHTSTGEITCLKVYKENLAIYKRDGVYLLTGSGPSNFAVVPFADKGAAGPNSVLTLNNRQYFFNRYGVFALAQVGELAQITLTDNVAANIAPAFAEFDATQSGRAFVVPYEAKNQVWFVVPGAEVSGEGGGSEVSGLSANDSRIVGTTIWVYDYVCRAWFKRVVPQNVTAAACISGRVYTADALGRVFVEDLTSTFDGEAVRFRFSSPFLTLGEPNVRKTVEEFYFVFDEARDNRFNFAVSKDYLSSEKDDLERISDYQPRAVLWDTFAGEAANATCWAGEDDAGGALAGAGSSGGAVDRAGEACFWAEAVESAYKTEINDSNLAVQLHFEGRELEDDLAIIGLEFKEVYYD